MHVRETTPGDGCKQVFHRGELAVTQLKGGAKRTVSHLRRLELERLTAVGWPAHPDARLRRRLKGDGDLITAMQADTAAAGWSIQGPGSVVIMRPKAHQNFQPTPRLKRYSPVKF